MTAVSTTARAQAMTHGVLSVGYQKKLTFAAAGAVAAYSLNANCVTASATDGIVTVFGAGTCDTWIVVITSKGTQSLQVHVVLPPRMYPPGFIPPQGTGMEQGVSHYEFRYISDPGEVENTFDSIRQQGSFRTHLHVAGVAPFSPTGTESAWSFPYLYYNVSRPRFHMTLFDQIVTNSPLTVNNTLVRGFHLRAGRWQFHAGYTSIFAFQNVLMPLQKESVVGIGYRIPAGPHGSLTANFYSIQAPTSDQAAQSGELGSLVYEYKRGERFDFLAELGYSHKPGAAFRLLSSGADNRLVAHFRYEPSQFAGVGLNNFHGLFGDFDWDHRITDKLHSTLDLSEQHYNLPQLRQTNFVSRAQVEYRPSLQWTFSGGGGYSLFEPSTSAFPKVSSLEFPVGVSFDTLHFGAGFQYTYSRNNSVDLGGQEFRASLRGGFKQVYGSAFYDRQTQTPTLGFILQQVPGLQQAMSQLELQATSPSDIARLFENNLTLQDAGLLNGLTINLSPVRTQWGANLTWSGRGRGRQQVQLGLTDEHFETLQSTIGTVIGTISYMRQMGFDNALSVSFSAYRSNIGGLTASLHPLAEVTFEHQFHSAPGLFMRVQHGVIAGKVFRDKTGTGSFSPNSVPLTGVEVVLDGTHRTKTNSHGSYQFTRIPYGPHTVQVLFRSRKPFFYTTPSKVVAEINTRVDFGVTFSLGRLLGVLRNDAGSGIANAHVVVVSAKHRYEATTGDRGEFFLSGMGNGTYRVSVDPNSLPPGYWLNGLKPVPVEVNAGTPARVALNLKAMRSISGRVRWLDPRRGVFVPVPGVAVKIPALGLESTTDAKGRYLFRQLAAGTWEVRLQADGRKYAQKVRLGTGPEIQRNVDFNIVAQRTPVSLTQNMGNTPHPARLSEQRR